MSKQFLTRLAHYESIRVLFTPFGKLAEIKIAWGFLFTFR